MIARRRTRQRNGFALLTVLWVLSGMTALVMLVNRTASEAIGTAQNRSDGLRSTWDMEGCLARARASIDERLGDASDVDEIWGNLDQVADNGALDACELVFRPVGTTLDVNVAGHDRLLALFAAAGMDHDHADSIAAAITHWRDTDDNEERVGAERRWYRARGRPSPRNGAFAANEELRLVRGLETPSAIDPFLSVEPGRVLLTRAPAPVLATLPGFGAEAVARTIELRERGPFDIARLAAALSPVARARLEGHRAELSSLATVTPDAWLLISRGRRATTGSPTSIEVRLIRSGRRAAVMRHRTNPWS